jgi:hypothetical protein
MLLVKAAIAGLLIPQPPHGEADHQHAREQSKLSRAKSRSAGNNRVRLEAARRTIEELEGHA